MSGPFFQSDYGDRGAHDKTLNPLKLVPPKRRSAPASLPPPPPRQEIQSYAPTTLTNQIRIQKYTTGMYKYCIFDLTRISNL